MKRGRPETAPPSSPAKQRREMEKEQGDSGSGSGAGVVVLHAEEFEVRRTDAAGPPPQRDHCGIPPRRR